LNGPRDELLARLDDGPVLLDSSRTEIAATQRYSEAALVYESWKML
jgi:hypothetical protein